ncbi:MAG: DUF481 domain-containing protein [Planctomycetota bacterium]
MNRVLFGCGVVAVWCPVVCAQTTAGSAAELLELLRAQGVDVSGYTANEDGTVTFAPPPATSHPDPGAAPGEPASSPGPEPPAEPPEPEATWSHSFRLGYGASYGNTENESLRLGFDTTRESARSKLEFSLDYYYATEDSEATDNELFGAIEHDWLNPDSPWLYFVAGTYEYDQFEDFDHRLAANAGVGYFLFRRADFEFSLRGGGGFSREFGSDNDDITPEVVLGADLEWQITETQSFVVESRAFPDLDETGEFRTRTGADYKIALDRGTGLSLAFGVVHEYESDVEPGTDEHDVKLSAQLVFDF